jgi:TonB family protein
MMTLYWLVYAAAIGLLLSLAAIAAERTVRLYGGPTRWIWLVAMLGAVALPFVLQRYPAPAPVGGGGSGVLTAVPELEGITAVVSAGTGGSSGWSAAVEGAGGWIVPVWVVASFGLGLLLVISAASLRRGRREWEPARVGDAHVLLSRDTGPAVLGLLRPCIVLPRRVLDWDEDRRRLIVLHEEEHIRARDPWLLGIAMLTVVAMPWNAGLWWQYRRLQLAVETDCDARVLRGRHSVHRYGSLLLEVGSWGGGGVPAGAGFAEPRSFLERRLRIMTAPTPKFRLARGLGMLTVAGLAVAAACEMPRPTGPMGPTAVEQPAPSNAVNSLGEARPTFTPFEVRPELRNRSEVASALAEEYPALLRRAGIGGNAMLWLFVDEEGTVKNVRVAQSSGHPQIDDAAERVAYRMRFSPALNRDERVSVWIQVPISFNPASDGAVAPGAVEERQRRADAVQRMRDEAQRAAGTSVAPASPDEPVFTPFEVRPELRNRSEVARALQANYPSMLRDAGIGGTAGVWVFIDEEGTVRQARINNSSGHPDLDAAAEMIAREMRFSPALNRGERVGVWIQIPITFQVQ